MQLGVTADLGHDEFGGYERVAVELERSTYEVAARRRREVAVAETQRDAGALYQLARRPVLGHRRRPELAVGRPQVG